METVKQCLDRELAVTYRGLPFCAEKRQTIDPQISLPEGLPPTVISFCQEWNDIWGDGHVLGEGYIVDAEFGVFRIGGTDCSDFYVVSPSDVVFEGEGGRSYEWDLTIVAKSIYHLVLKEVRLCQSFDEDGNGQTGRDSMI